MTWTRMPGKCKGKTSSRIPCRPAQSDAAELGLLTIAPLELHEDDSNKERMHVCTAPAGPLQLSLESLPSNGFHTAKMIPVVSW